MQSTRAALARSQKVLKAKLKNESLQLLSTFKALLDSTTNDLADTLCQSFSVTGIPAKWSKDEILVAKNKSVEIAFHSFPIEWLSSSMALAGPLAKRLKDNLEFGAARTAVGVTDTEWDQLVKAYTAELVRVGVPYALERMLQNESKFYSGETILAIAKGEAYKIHGVDGYYNLVKTYEVPSLRGAKPSLSKARRIWSKRHGSRYLYKKGVIP